MDSNLINVGQETGSLSWEIFLSNPHITKIWGAQGTCERCIHAELSLIPSMHTEESVAVETPERLVISFVKSLLDKILSC
jgi:hypothetical protein